MLSPLTIEEIAQIIVDKEIPLSLRMGIPGEYAEEIQSVLDAIQKDEYSGLNYDQVLAKLRENIRQAS